MPHSQETPCQCLTSQSKDLQEALQKIKELASENAALKEQMAAKEAGWDAEKSRILKALYAERALHKKVKADLRQKMEAGMKKVAEKTPIQEAKHQSNSTVEQVDSDRMASARQEIAMWKHRHDTVFDCWKTEVRSLKALLASQEEASNSKCEAIEQDLSSVLEEAASQLNQSTEEKAQLTARVAALEAQNKESSDLIKYLQINLQYNQANWRLRVSDLEEKVSSQQRESTRMVELWCQRESILKEEVQLLTQKNSQLEVGQLRLSFPLGRNHFWGAQDSLC